MPTLSPDPGSHSITVGSPSSGSRRARAGILGSWLLFHFLRLFVACEILMARDSSTARRLRTRARIHVALRYTHTHTEIYSETPLLRQRHCEGCFGDISHVYPVPALASHRPGASSAPLCWAQQGLGAARLAAPSPERGSHQGPGSPVTPQCQAVTLQTGGNPLDLHQGNHQQGLIPCLLYICKRW